MARGVTEAIADFVVSLDFDDCPPAAANIIQLATLDTIGCMAAGSTVASQTVLGDWVREMGGREEAVVVGLEFRAPVALAALVNGTAGHALDFDDVSPTMCHPSVCLLPVLLALGEKLGASGREFMLAYLAGFEVFTRLCRAMNPVHYRHGWHSTGTIGTIGAVAAAGTLLRLDRAQMRTALGIAASSASGVRQNFGSMVKPLHAGRAAFNGACAALLAQRGFTANLDALDGPRGFVQVLGGSPQVSVDASLFDDRPLELLSSGIGFKRFACCAAIHTALDALLSLLQEHEIRPQDVAHIDCAVNRRALDILVYSRPETPLEGKFSVQYSIAVAVFDRWAGLNQYAEERVRDPAVREMMVRVSTSVDESFTAEYATFPSRVTVRLVDGREFSLHVEVPKGYPSNPLAPEELQQKFRECCARRLSSRAIDDVVRLIGSLATVPDIRDLSARLLRTSTISVTP